MGDYDFDLEDLFGGSGGGIDLSEAISFGDVLKNLDTTDLAEAFNFGDLSGIGGIDLSDAITFGDLSGITGGIEGAGAVQDIVGQGAAGVQGIEGFGDIADIVGQGAAGIEGIEGFGDIADIVGQGAAGIPGIEGFGDVADIVGQGATGITGIEGFGAAADEVGQGATGITGIEGFGAAADEVGGSGGGVDYGETFGDMSKVTGGIEGSGEASDQVGQGADTRTKDPYEIDGAQGSRTEETATKSTIPEKTEVIKTDEKKTTPTTTKTETKTDTKKTSLLEQLFGGDKKNQALMVALLGGLLGLLSKSSAPKGPVGYEGGIPKYTATRVPGRGVQYTRAAGGGLMDLAQGGRPARYLRGGTDGMADKIKTDIDGKQPARLSHGEFVIPADVVSHLGNGNSDAGADVLYEMMDKVRRARTGTEKQGKQINPRKYIPA